MFQGRDSVGSGSEPGEITGKGKRAQWTRDMKELGRIVGKSKPQSPGGSGIHSDQCPYMSTCGRGVVGGWGSLCASGRIYCLQQLTI